MASMASIAAWPAWLTSGCALLSSRVAHNYKFVCSTPGLVSSATEYCFGNGLIGGITGDGSTNFGFVEVPPGIQPAG